MPPMVRLWDSHRGQCYAVLPAAGDDDTVAIHSTRPNLLATSGPDGGICLWELDFA